MQGPGLGKSRSAAHILLPAFFHFLVSSTTKLEEPWLIQFLELEDGFEPSTYALRVRRSAC